MSRRHAFTTAERAEADLVLGVWTACEMGPEDRAALGVSAWGMILAEHAVDAVPDEVPSYAGDAWFALVAEARSLLANGWLPGDGVDGVFRGLLEPEHCPCWIDGSVVMTNGRGVPLPPEPVVCTLPGGEVSAAIVPLEEPESFATQTLSEAIADVVHDEASS